MTVRRPRKQIYVDLDIVDELQRRVGSLRPIAWEIEDMLKWCLTHEEAPWRDDSRFRLKGRPKTREEPSVKRPVGRPRKEWESEQEKPKRPRGRPKGSTKKGGGTERDQPGEGKPEKGTKG